MERKGVPPKRRLVRPDETSGAVNKHLLTLYKKLTALARGYYETGRIKDYDKFSALQKPILQEFRNLQEYARQRNVFIKRVEKIGSNSSIGTMFFPMQEFEQSVALFSQNQTNAGKFMGALGEHGRRELHSLFLPTDIPDMKARTQWKLPAPLPASVFQVKTKRTTANFFSRPVMLFGGPAPYSHKAISAARFVSSVGPVDAAGFLNKFGNMRKAGDLINTVLQKFDEEINSSSETHKHWMPILQKVSPGAVSRDPVLILLCNLTKEQPASLPLLRRFRSYDGVSRILMDNYGKPTSQILRLLAEAQAKQKKRNW
ncbi:MAG: hypothetical protein V1676_02260 [Candidatus Diapherotrites archaeon]